MTPYERGYASGLNGQPRPPFPKGDASWAEKLVNRGWIEGSDERLKLQARCYSRFASCPKGLDGNCAEPGGCRLLVRHVPN